MRTGPVNQNMTDSRDDTDAMKDLMIRLRVTAEERAHWQAEAEADQRTLSDWIRVTCNSHVKPGRAKAKPSKRGGR